MDINRPRHLDPSLLHTWSCKHTGHVDLTPFGTAMRRFVALVQQVLTIPRCDDDIAAPFRIKQLRQLE